MEPESVKKLILPNSAWGDHGLSGRISAGSVQMDGYFYIIFSLFYISNTDSYSSSPPIPPSYFLLPIGSTSVSVHKEAGQLMSVNKACHI